MWKLASASETAAERGFGRSFDCNASGDLEAAAGPQVRCKRCIRARCLRAPVSASFTKSRSFPLPSPRALPLDRVLRISCPRAFGCPGSITRLSKSSPSFAPAGCRARRFPGNSVLRDVLGYPTHLEREGHSSSLCQKGASHAGDSGVSMLLLFGWTYFTF